MRIGGHFSITADARIDGREELIAKLARPPQTQDDSELILLAYETWGEDCLKHLIGDFAFAIWDSRSRRLFCARDHFGVKPFFFRRVANTLKFSTNLNSLRSDSDTLNDTAIGDYLVFGLNQDLSTTTFREIQRLPPAHSLTLYNGSLSIRRYWTPDTSKEVRYRDRDSYVEHFRELLHRAVKDRLSTRRVAVSMSGGLDSTSLAAVACDSGADVHACAVVYDKLIPDEERYYATAAAKHLGIPISYVVADRYSLFDEQVAGDMDQPEPFLLSPRTAQFHTLLRLCEAHSNVAFTGFDGDAFMNEPKRRRFKIRSTLRRILNNRPEEPVLPEWIDESFARRINLLDRLKQSFTNHVNPDERRPSAMWALDSKVWAPLFEGYDPGATKLNLELRHPFIDVRLVEYLLAIPPVPWCMNKYILRLAMKDRLPLTVINRPKTPLAGDPTLQLIRDGSVRWLDSFEVNPQLKSFVNLSLRRSIADELTPDGRWASLRVFALNYWLTNSLPMDRRTTENQVSKNEMYRTSIA
ncbi:MAG TPA: asparagine synthase-related protein [Pyrinomonadaceae bacterium]|nr:asparagine synthase-related protein [Pyrinomonadaceae bacterium]